MASNDNTGLHPTEASVHSRTPSRSVGRVLVLGGGGVRGAFQAGAIKAIVSNGFAPDAVYGTSVGALNAAFLVERASRYDSQKIDWLKISDALIDFWLNELDQPDKLWTLRNRICLLIDIVRNQFKSVLDTSRWSTIIDRSLSERAIHDSPVKLKINTVDINTQANFYADNGTTHIKDYIIASASLPFLMPLVKIGASAYCDGGTRHVVLLKHAVRDGAGSVVCVVCEPGQEKIKPVDELGSFTKLLERIADISSARILEDDLELIDANSSFLRKSPDCHVASLEGQKEPVAPLIVRPAEALKVDLMKFTRSDIEKMIDAGFRQGNGLSLAKRH
jgi:NTE family protein